MVCKGALKGFKIQPHLVLVDKSQLTSVEGLNQKFLLKKLEGRTTVIVRPGTDLKSVGNKILFTCDVSEVVDRIFAGDDQGAKSRQELGMPCFMDEAKNWAKAYLARQKIGPTLSKDCKTCEFRTAGSKKSGFSECWSHRLKAEPPKGGLVIDLWKFSKAADLIEEGRLLLSEVTKDDLKIETDPHGGMTNGQRQWAQVERYTAKSKTPAVDLAFLRSAMSGWKYPLHCIDFEATMVAIPFYAGRRPYEQVAFQFSHHTIQEDGSVAHAGEYLHSKRGEFPNFEFVRSLKKQLDKDGGTIFRYASFENTVLCSIYRQLAQSSEPDREELMAFIKTITKSSKGDVWEGERNMVDLLEIVKRGYYHPLAHGSNSIKKVLPAVLNESAYLKQRYSSSIYGSAKGISSANFQNHIWVTMNEAGEVIDPYKQLKPVFEGIDQEVIDSFLSDDEELAEGGAAMTAYAMMQFTEMSELETQRLREALLRYCELDTLAMVMIIEHFFELTGQLKVKKAI